jgi:hypothetical protein
MQSFRLIFFIVAVAVFSSCEQKPLYQKNQKKSSETKTDNSSDVGVADAADYATGALPLKVLKETEKKIDDIQTERAKQLENIKKD